MPFGRRFNYARVSLLVLSLACCGGHLAQAATVPSPWVAQDIGAPSPTGSALFDQGVFTVAASGKDIYGRSDQFQFVYQQVVGDVEIIARVDSIYPADPWSKAGVMIRGSLAAGAANGYALLSAARGLAFQRRAQSGGASSRTLGGAATEPRWVRLVRVGTTVSGYSSADGTTWTSMGSATISLGTTAYVGLAVTSHSTGTLTTANISQVAVIPLSLPTPQQDADVGAPDIAGSASYRLGVYTIKAGGNTIGGMTDQFNYVYQQITGDVDLVARVTSLAYTNILARAGVMVRESLAANSRHAFAFTYPAGGGGVHFRRRIDAGGDTVDTSGGSGGPPVWVRLVRSANQFQAFRSADGQTWTSIGTDTVPMSNTVYVGLALTSHDGAATATVVIDHLKVTLPSAPTNQPPTVSLTVPASGASFAAPADITVGASASDPEGRMARVEFYADATRIGSDPTSPYSVNWASVPVGTYSLTAVAFDADGASATSTIVTIDVGPGANQPPTVSLTTPVNGASYTAPATVTVSATAADPEGRLARVEFYAGTSLLGTDTTSPYAITWSAVAAGTYAVKAIAYDSDGGSATSATATITVSAPTSAPRQVAFHASSDHSSNLVTSYLLDVFASGANPNTATPIGSSDLGKPTPDANGDITVDRSTFFSALVPGNYIATVSAIGPGGLGRSAPVGFSR